MREKNVHKLFWFSLPKPDRLFAVGVCKNRGDITLYVMLLINMTLFSAFTAFVFRAFLFGTDSFNNAAKKK